MSKVVNEADFMGGMAQIVVPRTQKEERDKGKAEQQSIKAALAPAIGVLTEIIDSEIKSNGSTSTYTPLIDTANPDGNLIYQELRARQLYTSKLSGLKKLIEKAAAEVRDD